MKPKHKEQKENKRKIKIALSKQGIIFKRDKTAINTKIISNKSHTERESSNPNFILRLLSI